MPLSFRLMLVLPIAGLAPLALVHAAPHARDVRPPDWRAVIEDRDRDRLRGWRQAWLDGLGAARAAGAEGAIAAEGAVLRPDAAEADPALPDGAYRCRILKLGTLPGSTAPAFVRMPPVSCLVADGRIATIGGGQRPAGWTWPFDGVRLIFLGSLTVGDERAALPYGRDRERNLAGFVERIGDRHWRLVLPRPQWEAMIDVIDILPVPVDPHMAAPPTDGEG